MGIVGKGAGDHLWVSWAKDLARRMGRGKVTLFLASFFSPGSPVLGSLSPTQAREPAGRLFFYWLLAFNTTNSGKQDQILFDNLPELVSVLLP